MALTPNLMRENDLAVWKRRRRVAEVCRSLIGQGLYPSGRAIMMAAPDLSPDPTMLARVRDGLVREGRFEIPAALAKRRHGGDCGFGQGLLGTTAAERAEIDARIAEIRAVKRIEGEPPYDPRRDGLRLRRRYHTPDAWSWRSQEQGRGGAP